MHSVFIDINADVGELPEGAADAELMQLITSANVACGGHAGDETSMQRTLGAAREANVAVGAHPSYPDRKNFGRATMEIKPESIEAAVREQVERLLRVAEPLGVRIGHMKPHGALYHDARDRSIAEAIGRAALRLNPELVMVGQAGSPALGYWRAMGLRCAAEAFADRAYEANGALCDRKQPGALLTDPMQAARQALDIAVSNRVVTRENKEVAIAADTICVHSDTPNAAAIAREIRRRFAENGVEVVSIQDKRFTSRSGR
jgi:UPF0271 protein